MCSLLLRQVISADKHQTSVSPVLWRFETRGNNCVSDDDDVLHLAMN